MRRASRPTALYSTAGSPFASDGAERLVEDVETTLDSPNTSARRSLGLVCMGRPLERGQWSPRAPRGSQPSCLGTSINALTLCRSGRRFRIARSQAKCDVVLHPATWRFEDGHRPRSGRGVGTALDTNAIAERDACPHERPSARLVVATALTLRRSPRRHTQTTGSAASRSTALGTSPLPLWNSARLR